LTSSSKSTGPFAGAIDRLKDSFLLQLTVVCNRASVVSARYWLPAVIASYVAIAFIAVMFVPINQDEGWYLQASRMVYEGKIPYRDSSYTQTPLLPYVYGLINMFIPGGLAVGRTISAMLGLLCLWESLWIGKQLGGRLGALTTASLLAFNVLFIQHIVMVKTYALAGALLTGSVAIIVRSEQSPSLSQSTLAMFLMMLACLTRLSLLPLYLVLVVYLAAENRGRALSILLIGAMGLVILALPFILWPQEASFNLWYVHTGGYANSDIPLIQSTWRTVYRKLLFVSDVARDYAPGYMVSFVGTAFMLATKRRRNTSRIVMLLSALWFSSFVADAVAAAPQGGYRSILYPVVAIYAGLCVSRVDKISNHAGQTMRALVFISVALAAINAIPGLVAIHAGKPPLLRLHDVATAIRKNNLPGHPILTLDTIVAVEAEYPVVRGTEMSLFSFYGEMDTEDALKFHVVNMELLESAALDPETLVVVMSDEAWQRLQGRWIGVVHVGPPSWSSDRFERILEMNYVGPVLLDNAFARPGNRLFMWVRKRT